PDIAPFAPRLSMSVRHDGRLEPRKRDKAESDNDPSGPESAVATGHGETASRTVAPPSVEDPRLRQPGFRAPSSTFQSPGSDTPDLEPSRRRLQRGRATVDGLLRALPAGTAPRQIRRFAKTLRTAGSRDVFPGSREYVHHLRNSRCVFDARKPHLWIAKPPARHWDP